jgi:UDP-N-acetylglucosamine 1-carboxyvinyltransferase
MLTKAKGKSVIREHVWKTRFSYASELKKIGFNFEIGEGELIILPSTAKNIPATLHAYDLRAAAVLSIGACLNQAQTSISGLEHLNRGYEDLLSFLSSCGAKWHKLTQ